MIYIKNIFVVSLINNKFLAISTCINKDLFIILPITKIYIYKNTRLKKKILTQQCTTPAPQPNQDTHKKHKTNPIAKNKNKIKIIQIKRQKRGLTKQKKRRLNPQNKKKESLKAQTW